MKIFSFPLYGKSHAVIPLPVHSPDEEKVHFREGDPLLTASAFSRARQTKSLEWFSFNQRDPEARSLLYFVIVQKCTWEPKQKTLDTKKE